MSAPAAAAAHRHVFVVPDLDGPPTGGTLYNAQLIAALRASGVACEDITLADAPGLAASAAGSVWVDSLYLDALPALRARSGACRLFLIAHYLPSLVARGCELDWHELSVNEQAAIAAADGFLVTSAFMHGQLARFALMHAQAARAVVCVEPGSEAPPRQPVTAAARAGAATNALMLCNVVQAKGIHALLTALAGAARASDRFTLSIAGRLDLEPGYAATCSQLIAQSDALRGRVVLCGALPHAQALARLATCDVLLSASRMESYGMALAEARAAGVPVIARHGGHAQALVAAEAGGRLVDDEAAVGASFLELVRNPTLLAERQHAALHNTRVRTWQQAAAEFVARVQSLAS